MNISRTLRPNGIQDVKYKKPIIRRTHIGNKPEHHFDQNPLPTESYVSVASEPFAKGKFEVFADIPDKNADGSPTLVEVEEQIDLRPRSPWKYGGIAGGVGALVGAGVGALTAGNLGMATGVAAGVGALAVGGIAGSIGAFSVYGEKTKLVWDQHQIVDHKMNGYRELVGPGTKGDTEGHFHRYIADIESKTIGDYETPRVLRYKGEHAPEQGQKLSPEQDTPSKDIPGKPGKQLDVTVTFEEEKLRSRRLGSIPSDYWSYSGWGGGYTSCGPSGCEVGSQSIYRNTPVYEPNSEPRVDTVTRRIEAKAYSVPLFAAGGSILGGAAGFGLGYLAGHLLGIDQTTTGMIGAGLAGMGSGIAAGNYAHGDHVKLEWREYGIHEKKLVGYTEHVTPHYETRCKSVSDGDGGTKQECETVQNGWDHSFTPDVRSWSVGSYIGPKVVHFQKKDGELMPVEEKTAPQAQQKVTA